MSSGLALVLLAACAFEFPVLAVAGEKSYELAKITVISPLQMQVPVTITDTAMPIPTTVGCEFELLQGDFVYRGFCQHGRLGKTYVFVIVLETSICNDPMARN